MPIDIFKFFESSLGLNRSATKFVVGGLLVLVAAAWLISKFGDIGLSVIELGVALVVFSAVIAILSNLSGIIKLAVSWFVTLFFIIWASLVLVQAATENTFTVGEYKLATARCIAKLGFDVQCSVTNIPARFAANINSGGATIAAPVGPSDVPAAAIELTDNEPTDLPDEVAISASIGTMELFLGDTDTDTDTAIARAVLPVVPDEVPVSSGPGASIDDHRLSGSSGKTYIQFAGTSRLDVIKLAGELDGKGWNVQGADRGGERTGDAAGLMEVRYFNQQDSDDAAKLARAVSVGLSWQPDVTVRDFSESRYAKSQSGHLEVWLSK